MGHLEGALAGLPLLITWQLKGSKLLTVENSQTDERNGRNDETCPIDIPPPIIIVIDSRTTNKRTNNNHKIDESIRKHHANMAKLIGQQLRTRNQSHTTCARATAVEAETGDELVGRLCGSHDGVANEVDGVGEQQEGTPAEEV